MNDLRTRLDQDLKTTVSPPYPDFSNRVARWGREAVADDRGERPVQQQARGKPSGRIRRARSFTSHQLRTPLTGIRWMLELVTQIADLPEDAREYVGDAQASANRLIGLVGDLLAASRLEDGRVRLDAKPTDVGELTQVCLHDVAGTIATAGHRISVLGARDLGVIETDPLLVRQVIANL